MKSCTVYLKNREDYIHDHGEVHIKLEGKKG